MGGGKEGGEKGGGWVRLQEGAECCGCMQKWGIRDWMGQGKSICAAQEVWWRAEEELAQGGRVW